MQHAPVDSLALAAACRSWYLSPLVSEWNLTPSTNTSAEATGLQAESNCCVVIADADSVRNNENDATHKRMASFIFDLQERGHNYVVAKLLT